ncbi:MAG TPA: diacylglycerol kinase family protein [Gemmataceae bacterium]|jgi:YegS/Rv2252/BmrU family lipid kinase|nr:diacylglycerol kinase family protein [Gemmataceae bacterium]
MGECVIVNPAAGRGRARRLIARLGRLRRPSIAVWPTSERGHAVELAERAVADGFTTVIAAGGDGTVHEVANGLLRAGRSDVVLGVWPIGSANDYAYALGIDGDWPLRRRTRLSVRPVDVGRVTAAGRVSFFVNGLGIGFNGAVTYESQQIRGLRGMALYGLAFLKSVVRHFDSPPLTISLDGKERPMRTLAFSINIGKREGGFRVTPNAVLDDGLFDYVLAGPLTRWRALTMLPRLVTGTLPADDPSIRLGRCREVRVRSESKLRIHTDGELFPGSDGEVRELTIELLPAALLVLRNVDGS